MNYTFRLIAYNETEYWLRLPPECKKVYGVYLFCEGEATHVCSLTPSSWCEFIENVFIGLNPENMFAVDNENEDGDEPGSYFHFIDPACIPDRVSKPIEFEADYRDDAWEQARDYFQSNRQSIPIVDREYVEAT